MMARIGGGGGMRRGRSCRKKGIPKTPRRAAMKKGFFQNVGLSAMSERKWLTSVCWEGSAGGGCKKTGDGEGEETEGEETEGEETSDGADGAEVDAGCVRSEDIGG